MQIITPLVNSSISANYDKVDSEILIKGIVSIVESLFFLPTIYVFITDYL